MGKGQSPFASPATTCRGDSTHGSSEWEGSVQGLSAWGNPASTRLGGSGRIAARVDEDIELTDLVSPRVQRGSKE